VNLLVALSDPDHVHNSAAHRWFRSLNGTPWLVCPLTEAGFVRVSTNPRISGSSVRNFAQAAAILASLKKLPGYNYLPVKESWAALTAPFVDRITGHQQVTDAYLLGLAIKESGVLVTFDRGLKYLAGSQFGKNLLILE
jgi:toxin-antitoxin system PIN domain toxin